MKITFENYEENNDQTFEICTRENDSMYLRITNVLNETNGTVFKDSWYELSPKELSSIIGSLLHLQSKIKKTNSNGRG